MTKAKKMVMGLGALALILGMSGSIAGTAEAFRGDPTKNGPNYTTELHTAMQTALETNDYDAWKELLPNKNSRVAEVITKDNFAKFAEAYRLAKSGDLTGAKAIRQELGLGLKDGSGLGKGNGVNGWLHSRAGVNK